MRFAVILSIPLILTGCSAYNSTGSNAVPAKPTLKPGSASTVYTIGAVVAGSDPNNCGFPTNYVSSVIGYPANASGPVSPTITINSPNTVDAYEGLATDASGNIYVLAANFGSSCIPGVWKVLMFAPVASGTVTATPTRTIAGPATQIVGAARLTVDSAGNIYMWVHGSDSPSLESSTILEFAAAASGNVAPIRTINVAQYPSSTGSGYPAGLAVDGNGNIVFAVSNGETSNGTVNEESDMIQVFTPGQSGNATPVRTISGPQSQLTQISGLALDPAGNIYVEMATFGTAANPTILEFSGGANGTGTATPINSISGNVTMLDRFFLDSLTVDGAGNIYALTYTFPGQQTNYLLRFAAGANGNAAPTPQMLSEEGMFIATH